MHIISITLKCVIALSIAELSIGQGDLFKINKLNLIWNKAQHSLGPTKLKDLKNDLSKHEADELSLKKLKAHNQDKDGLVEASVRKRLLSIMAKYSLERYLDDISATPQKAESVFKTEAPKNIPTFRDSKLDKLWKKAEKAGFSQEQLMVLHEEFQHQQEKLDDHYETMNVIEEEINRANANMDREENSIEETPEESNKGKYDKKKKNKNKKESESEKKARLDSNIHQSLKEKHSNIKKSIDELAKKISSGAIDDKAPFKEARVNDLWLTAQKSNFTEAELKSLKEELKHYESRIEKLKHFQNQLERYEIGAKADRSYAEDDKEMKHVKNKVKELAQKVNKSDKTIEKKVLREEL